MHSVDSNHSVITKTRRRQLAACTNTIDMHIMTADCTLWTLCGLLVVGFRDCVMQQCGLKWVDRHPTYHDKQQDEAPGWVKGWTPDPNLTPKKVAK